MTYQKARFFAGSAILPALWGKEVWIESTEPVIDAAQDIRSGQLSCSPVFTAATVGVNGLKMAVDADCIELLPEFQEDVPIITFADWCRENGIEEEQL